MPDSNITKRALAASMKELMNRTPFTKISVGDICEQCGMNRKSFYYHFRDKYELVNWIYYTEFAQVVLERMNADERDVLTEMCRYFHQNRAFYVNALKVTGQDSFREYFAAVLKPILTAYLDASTDAGDRRDFFATFYTDALLSAIERWLSANDMTPEEFSSLLARAMALG